jgi:hypothetical protein
LRYGWEPKRSHTSPIYAYRSDFSRISRATAFANDCTMINVSAPGAQHPSRKNPLTHPRCKFPSSSIRRVVGIRKLTSRSQKYCSKTHADKKTGGVPTVSRVNSRSEKIWHTSGTQRWSDMTRIARHPGVATHQFLIVRCLPDIHEGHCVSCRGERSLAEYALLCARAAAMPGPRRRGKPLRSLRGLSRRAGCSGSNDKQYR